MSDDLERSLETLGFHYSAEHLDAIIAHAIKKRLGARRLLHFSEWPKIFPGAACTTALIDRVVHHADIIPIEGESYRLRDANEAKKKRRSRSRRRKT